MIRRALAAAAIAGLLVASTAAAASVIVQSGDATGDGYLDYWALDDSGDGVIDRLLLDYGHDGVAEVVVYSQGAALLSASVDTNGDGPHDTILQAVYTNGRLENWIFWRDADQNGAWENGYYDGDHDRFPEWVSVDTNGDGTADRWVGNAAPGGYSATAAIARQVAAVGAMQTLMAGNVPIFGPLAWPVGG